MNINEFKTEMDHTVCRITTDVKGPHVLVFGAIHGDETCGPDALLPMIEMFKAGELTLNAGTLTIVPICNLKAHEENDRQVEENLNRVFKKTDAPKSLEAQYANALLPLLEGADYLVDLHSASAVGPAFVFDDYEDAGTQFLASHVPCDYVVKGWNTLYPDAGGDVTTTDAAAKLGVAAICLECGEHNDPKAPEVGHEGVLNVLRGLDMTDGKAITYQPTAIRMTEVVYRPTVMEVFSRDWLNFHPVEKGTILIQDKAGKPTRVANDDCIMLMPKSWADVGEEWYYLAKAE